MNQIHTKYTVYYTSITNKATTNNNDYNLTKNIRHAWFEVSNDENVWLIYQT